MSYSLYVSGHSMKIAGKYHTGTGTGWSNAPTTLLVAMMFGDNAMETTEEEVLPAFPQSDPIRY